MYDTILFDFFGVIFDDPQRAFMDRHAHLRADIAATARHLDTGAISYTTYFERLSVMSGEPVENLQEQFAAPELLNRPVVQTIAHLKHRWRIGLLSNTCTHEITTLFDEHNLRDLFHEVIISSETGLAKPDPRIFRLALRRMGSHANTTVFIDDNEANIAAARRVGMMTIHFKDHRQLRLELRKVGVNIMNPMGQEI